MTLSTTPSATRDSRAFTLVEMLLVVLIIGILASAAVPRYARSFASMKARSGAYEVAATLEYAKATSVLEGRVLRFEIIDRGASCRVVEPVPSAGRKAFRAVLHALPDGVTVSDIEFDNPSSSARSYVDFRPDGDLEPATVTVTGRSGDVWSVRVTRGAGHAIVTETGAHD